MTNIIIGVKDITAGTATAHIDTKTGAIVVAYGRVNDQAFANMLNRVIDNARTFMTEGQGPPENIPIIIPQERPIEDEVQARLDHPTREQGLYPFLSDENFARIRDMAKTDKKTDELLKTVFNAHHRGQSFQEIENMTGLNAKTLSRWYQEFKDVKKIFGKKSEQ